MSGRDSQPTVVPNEDVVARLRKCGGYVIPADFAEQVAAEMERMQQLATDNFNAGCTQSAYRYHYRQALQKIVTTGGASAVSFALEALDSEPASLTALNDLTEAK